MKLDKDGNYSPWTQPNYGKDAYGAILQPPEGYEIAPEGTQIESGWLAFDVYSGWKSGGEYHSRNKLYTKSDGRWTAWARPIEGPPTN